MMEISFCFIFVCVWQEPFSTVDESNLIPFVLLKPVPRCAKFPITTNENMQKGEIGQDETEAGKENTSTQNQENAHFSRGLCRCLCSSLCLIFCRTSVCSVQKVWVGFTVQIARIQKVGLQRCKKSGVKSVCTCTIRLNSLSLSQDCFPPPCLRAHLHTRCKFYIQMVDFLWRW